MEQLETNRRLPEAIRRGDLAEVRALLREGVDLESYSHGWTPLMWAAAVAETPETLEILTTLLDAGADVHARGKVGLTALCAAAAYGNLEAARLLIHRGAEVNAVHADGQTVLMTAAEAGAHHLIRLLLEHGADLHARNKYGEVALDFADRSVSDRGTRELLLQLGAEEPRRTQQELDETRAAMEEDYDRLMQAYAEYQRGKRQATESGTGNEVS